MSERIRILVADDHTVVRKGLCSLLSGEKYGVVVVGEAEDGLEAIEKAKALEPDVILMDLMMPKVDGIQAIRAIRQESPQSRILVLTSYGEEDLLLKAVDAGALGYMMKDASPDELVSSIKNVSMGRMSLPTELARKVMLRQESLKADVPAQLLTERESDVLKCVGKGYSNKQIALELGVEITTVRTHVSNLLRKLQLENRTQLALYARQQDLR